MHLLFLCIFFCRFFSLSNSTACDFSTSFPPMADDQNKSCVFFFLSFFNLKMFNIIMFKHWFIQHVIHRVLTVFQAQNGHLCFEIIVINERNNKGRTAHDSFETSAAFKRERHQIKGLVNLHRVTPKESVTGGRVWLKRRTFLLGESGRYEQHVLG